MEIQWLSNSFKGVVTLYETNITLNTVAASNFENAYATMIGYSKKDNSLIIKYLNKEEATSGVYNKNDLHTISIKPSYGRINGKNIIRSIATFYPLDFSKKNMYKFNSIWDVASKSLIVDLNTEVKG